MVAVAHFDLESPCSVRLSAHRVGFGLPLIEIADHSNQLRLGSVATEIDGNSELLP